jgi:predicted metal-binding protein
LFINNFKDKKKKNEKNIIIFYSECHANTRGYTLFLRFLLSFLVTLFVCTSCKEREKELIHYTIIKMEENGALEHK